MNDKFSLDTNILVSTFDDGDLEKRDRARALVAAGKVAGPKINDARIAAVCLQHGIGELWTIDRDFSRFPGLRVRNPLKPV